MEFRTRRTQDASTNEGCGWYFETEGVGTFGELRRDLTISRGTHVRLRLRNDLVGAEPEKWFERLVSYLRFGVRHLPCRLVWRSQHAQDSLLEIPPGWNLQEELLTNEVLDKFRRTSDATDEKVPLEMLSLAERQRRLERDEHFAAVRSEATKRLKWKFEYGELPNSFGRYVLCLPFFELVGGESLAFLRSRQVAARITLDPIGDGYVCVPLGTASETLVSWKGFPAQYGLSSNAYLRRIVSERILCFVDFIDDSAGKVAVHRNLLRLTAAGDQGLEWLSGRAASLCRDFVEKCKASRFFTLNCELSGLVWSGNNGSWLAFDGRSGQTLWSPLAFPAVCDRYPRRHLEGHERSAKWKGKELRVIPAIPVHDNKSTNPMPIRWGEDTRVFPPSRFLVHEPRGKFGLVWLWTGPNKDDSGVAPCGPTCPFPPQWPSLLGVDSDFVPRRQSIVWNRNHPITRRISKIAWSWAQDRLSTSADPLPLKNELLGDSDKAACWIVWCIKNQEATLWNGLNDRDPTLLSELWLNAFGAVRATQCANKLYVWNYGYAPNLDILTSKSWRRTIEAPEIRKLLSRVSSEWRIELPGSSAKRIGRRRQPRAARQM